jgi:hypothetical protein
LAKTKLYTKKNNGTNTLERQNRERREEKVRELGKNKLYGKYVKRKERILEEVKG